MGEAELAEIEGRIDQYPPQARHDIVRLTQELRQLYDARGLAHVMHAGSPLHDQLTGLLNGGAYGVRFAMARARATRFRNMFAVMSIAIDLTHAPADVTEREQTIRELADRLEDCLRETDTLARIGESEFAIILEDLGQAGHAERVKQIVQEALAEPLRMRAGKRAPSATVGLRFYPTPGAGAVVRYDA